MKFYIIGSVDLNNIATTTAKFNSVTVELMKAGHDVTNICLETIPWLPDRSTEAKHRMRFVSECDGVFVIPCWHEDKIAQHELMLACTLGKAIQWANNTHIPERMLFDTNISEHKTVNHERP